MWQFYHLIYSFNISCATFKVSFYREKMYTCIPHQNMKSIFNRNIFANQLNSDGKTISINVIQLPNILYILVLDVLFVKLFRALISFWGIKKHVHWKKCNYYTQNTDMCLWCNIISHKCRQCVESNYYYFIKYSTTEYLLNLQSWTKNWEYFLILSSRLFIGALSHNLFQRFFFINI